MIRIPLHRRTLLAGASVAALVLAGPAAAEPFGRRTAVDPAAQAARAAETAATRNVAATAAATRTRAAFAAAAQARQLMDGVQAAARVAALAGKSLVPNGLGAGGLQVAAGVGVDPTLWVNAAAPTQTTTGGRTAVTVTQTASKAILTWDSFNVGRETDLTFNQAGHTDWVALNRITGVTADPSKILGTIKADGAVYIINQNGIIFGGASQVNVRSLIASSLDIHGGTIETTQPNDAGGNPISDALWQQAKIAARDARFIAGLAAPTATPTFSDYVQNDYSATPPEVPTTDQVVVERGARIAVAPLGQAILLGHDVVNAGTITAPDGQVLLSAGGSIILQRGVDRTQVDGNSADGQVRGYVTAVRGYGKARNDGVAEATRGNVSLHADEVEQNGVIAVTTAIDRAGSIILDTSVSPLNGNTAVNVGYAYNYGTVSIGAGSSMSILPDASGATAVGNTFKPSTVEIFGTNISFGEGATLYAPGAKAFIYAPANALAGRFYLGAGATIDLSGLGDVTAPMSQNQIAAELRANELRDNPVLRDSALRGQSVFFDARLGSKLTNGTGVADLSGWYDLIPRTVSQFMTGGGSLTLQQSEIVTRAGSVIDLSGGSVHYADGMVRRTRLIDGSGKLVPIEFADTATTYVGIEGDAITSHVRWGITERFTSDFTRGLSQWQAGYDEGHSAGSLSVLTPGPGFDKARIFDGTVRADTVTGQYQVAAPAGSTVTDATKVWQERPALATLNFSSVDGFGRAPLGGNITIAAGGPRLDSSSTADTVLFDTENGNASLVNGIVAADHILPANWFDGKTFGTVALRAGVENYYTYETSNNLNFTPVAGHPLIGGVLTIGAGVTVNLGDYGKFEFLGRQAEIDGTIVAAGGSVKLQTVETVMYDSYTAIPGEQLVPGDVLGTHLGATGVIDVAGRWTNNLQENLDGEPLTQAVINGGSVTIVAHDLLLDAGWRIDVSGGAQLTTGGGSPILGNGGAILLDNSQGGQATRTAEPSGRIVLDGALVGYAPGRGGSLTVDTNQSVYIGGAAILPSGVLGAGNAAAVKLLLSADAVLPAGATLPFPVNYSAAVVPAGAAFAQDTGLYLPNGPLPPLAADWTVPGTDFYIQDDAGNTYFSGSVVPAGTVIPFLNGTFTAGSTLPADVFPNGIAFPSAVGLLQPAGVLMTPFTLPKGLAIAAGTVFGVDVGIVAPKTYAADFFTKGGFASYELAGSQGVTLTAGTILAPTIDTLTLGAVSGLATGARLGDLVLVAGSGVTLVNSASLPEARRPAMDLVLSTVATSIDGSSLFSRINGDFGRVDRGGTRSPGSVTVETGAAIKMSAGSRVFLDSVTGIAVDGTIDAAGGIIRIGGLGSSDYGSPGTQISIGDNARLTARGYQEALLAGGITTRTVKGGGQILIGGTSSATDSIGENQVRAVAIGAGAVLDVSGIHGTNDLIAGISAGIDSGRTDAPKVAVAVAVDGDAGTILVHGTTGIIAGSLQLAAGGATGRAGTLSIGQASPTAPLIVRQSTPAGLEPVTLASDIAQDGLTLVADSIHGVGQLTLATGHGYSLTHMQGILFDGSVTLSAQRGITLEADRIQRTIDAEGAPSVVTLSAPYVRFKGNDAVGPTYGDPVYATDLNGSLTVRANLIDLSGAMQFDCSASNCDVPGNGGFGTLLFQSAGDVRLIAGGGLDPNSQQPLRTGLTSGGDIIFDAAQVYVTNGISSPYNGGQLERGDADPGFLVQAGQRIVVRSNGAAAPIPLNFGERLTLRAPVIEQSGVLRAPAGQIRLEASDRLTLAPGSLTSVSLGGLTVPFGGGGFEGYGRVDWAPTRAVALTGGTVDAQAGSRVEVTGGGDLLGWSFVAGTGGTTDILANKSADGYFAILPSLGDRPAPQHPVANSGGLESTSNALSDPRLSVGDTIWLGDSAGVKAGYYILLPAYYALLDGALLVRPKGATAYASPFETVTHADGSHVTAGYTAVSGTAIRGPWSAFEVLDSKTWRQYSDFTSVSFNAQKSAAATLAGITLRTLADAGGVQVTAQDSLNLAGSMDFSAAKGLIGTLDIASDRIAVTNGTAPEGYLRVDAKQIEALGAGSVLIGGTGPSNSFAAFDYSTYTPFGIRQGVALTTVATDVLVTAGTTLKLGELLLIASDSVTIDDGAVLSATGKPGDPSKLLVAGDGALVRLTGGDRVAIVRTGAAGQTGSLRIGENARLTTAGALSLDASIGFDLAGTALLDVARLDLASDRINLGDVPAGESGTTIGLDTVRRLAASADLSLHGRQSIDLYGDLTLGARDGGGKALLAALTLDTALLQGHAEDGAGAALTVGVLTLTNSNVAGAEAIAGTAALALDVDTLVLGPGSTGVGGYAGIIGRVGEILTKGTGSLNVGGDLTLATGRVTAGTASKFELATSGALTLAHGDVPVAAAGPTLGGSLTLTGAELTLGTAIVANAGTVMLGAAGDIALLDGARIDVSGRAVDFRDTVKYAPGGIVRLTATGAVALAAGSLVDVSGAVRGGSAGIVEIRAAGDATLGGDLSATSAAGYAGGEFLLAANHTDFGALNSRLNTSGFDAARDITLRQDIVLDAGSSIVAHRVALHSEGGTVQIGGAIDARGNAADADGGVVLLSGAAVELTGTIDASAGSAVAGGYDPSSGTVELAGNSVTLGNGSAIMLGGGRQGGGRLMVRADRIGTGVNATLGGTTTGAREQTLVGMADYATDTVDADVAMTAIDAANGWLATVSQTAGWTTGAGIAFTSAGDLSVNSAIDLAVVNGAGYLGLKAAGDILVDASISDGFSSAGRDATLEAGRSFSYGFDAGRDVVIGADRLVRTGTGDIRVAAVRDLVLTTNGSVIYTAGSATPTTTGFDHSGFGPVAVDGGRVLGEFPTLGGNVSLAAGRDISAPIVTQSASAWLYRYGNSAWDGTPDHTAVLEQTSWSIVYGNFQSGVAAFGGGNVRVRAGRDIWDLGVALPTTGYLTTGVGNHAQASDLVVRGGGDLDVRAAGDLNGGFFVLGRGHAELTAGGNVGQGKLTNVVIGNVFDSNQTENRGLYPIIGLMDADVRVTAGGSATVEGVYDLTNVAQTCGNFGATCGGIVFKWADGNDYGFPEGATVAPVYQSHCIEAPVMCVVTGSPDVGSAFRGYSGRAGLDLIAIGGAAGYLNNGYAGTSVSLMNPDVALQIRPQRPPNGASAPLSLAYTAQVSPGTLRLAALSGSITLTPLPMNDNGLQLASAPFGTLALLASGDININYGSQQLIQLQDTGTAYLRDAFAPAKTDGVSTIDIVGNVASDPYATVGNNGYRGYTMLHAGDPEPVRIISVNGSLAGNASYGAIDWRLVTPKPIQIYAGLDIRYAILQPQNNSASDISSIVAGRDIVQRNGQFGVSILGEGLLWVEAGRNYTTEGYGSIISAGNGTASSLGGGTGVSNIALPDRGADVTLIAGTAQGSDYAGFSKLYLDPANLANPAVPLSNPANAGKVVHTYEKELDLYLAKLGVTGVTPVNRLALFAALPSERRGTFLNSVLTSELQQTGIDYNTPGGQRFQQYTRGYSALGSLYPATTKLTGTVNPAGGDILLYGGTVESRSGGSIQVIAPYGRVEVGNPSLSLPPNSNTQTGVITRRGGDIGLIANGSVGLDLSRVFTLQGGDILMWTSFGDITAGAGAKTSVTNVPLAFRQDQFGEVALDAFGLSTGAGIGVLDSLQGNDPDRKKSRLDLLAFFGEVNAGDAGIRVIGDLNIAALRVVNAANIQVSGDATGIPTIAAVNIGALTSASTAASAVSIAATQLAERSRPQPVFDLPTIVNVRFVGFGDE
ncbi:filamentous hemagglutinin family protein [Sphingosinicellaceae bacterium]|nr:filamentous hemagglutinin family protein [Sphingosinicellaceae bacterium]